MKNIRIPIISILMVILLSVTVFAEEENSSSNLFLFGSDVSSNHKVMGDIYALGQDIEVNNSVNGDVIYLGQDINIKADAVLGSIRGAGQRLDIDVKNTKNITVTGRDITIDEDSVSNAIYVVGQNIEFKGTTNDVHLIGENITIDGVVNGNLTVRGENITLGDNAFVNGDVTIKSENEPTITGSVAWRDINYEQLNYKDYYEESNIGLIAVFMNILSSIIVGILTYLILRNYFYRLNKEVNLYLGKFILLGLGLLIGIPILIVSSFLTVVGIPIGMIVLVIYILLMYISSIFTGIVVGQKILKNRNIYIQIIVGITFIKLMLLLPYIGVIVSLSCKMFTLGTTFMNLHSYFKNR